MFVKSRVTLLRPFRDFMDFNHIPSSLHLSYYPIQTKDIWGSEHLEGFPFISSQDKNRGFIVLSRKKKKLCIWYLEPSQKTGSYKISLCRGHTNKSQLGLQEIQGQTPASSLLMKRQLLPAAACQRCGADSFPSLYVLKEMLPEQERYTVPKYFFHKTFSSLTSA